jgi:predicted DNA-binding protein (MmcQ/YjbR family)
VTPEPQPSTLSALTSLETDRAAVLAQCAELPGADLTHPFGDHVAVFKVGGRIFAFVGLVVNPCRVTLKATPEQVDQLVQTHPAVDRGYHMDKRHWVTVTLDEGLPDGLVGALIDGSHELVVSALPPRRRPATAG